MSKTGYVYKLVSTDIEIKECYVGSTNNERVRKNQHKSCCNNEKDKWHNLYVYQFIRDNGGWENWDMIQIEEFKYNERRQLHTRERYWLETLQASLNKVKPTRTKKELLQYHNNYNTDYYEKNQKQILEKNKIKTTCECGSIYNKDTKARHEKSKKHINYLTTPESSNRE
jgi:hypothetical protein